jgi:hypothetical protein
LPRAGKIRAAMNKDVFNVFNGNAVTAENPSVPAAFCRPTQIMLAPFVKINAQLDF